MLLDLVVFINDLEHIIMNLTENMAFSQIFVRMIMWIYNDIINETIKDFDYRRYKSIEERQLFISYNARSKLFVKLLITFVVLTAPYYLTPILVSLGNGKEINFFNNLSSSFLFFFSIFTRILKFSFFFFEKDLQNFSNFTKNK